ncbi:MAG: efflux RND transporter periplasmic adaptor subunit [Chloroflexota bacterium]|nr:efflux RND transporter periplasmic adaptor subunit [Chloroflexota bacterium]
MKKINIYRAERSRRRSRSASHANRLLIFIIAILILSACGSVSTPTAIPTISIDNNGSPSNNQSSAADSISAAAVVVPPNEARLSFSTIGSVTSVEVKVGDKVTAGQTLVTLDTTIQEASVRQAEANLLAAQIQVSYQKRLGVDEVHIQTAEAEVARAQALLDSATAVLTTQSTLLAPFDGTIVSVDISPAETVVPGQVVIVLGDLSNYQIETTDLSERDVIRVQRGQTAKIFIEALNEEFSGKVIDVDRVSSTLGGDVVYTVTIDLDTQPKGLLWGMSADVQIETAE